jgi:hypothetical protein
VTPTAPDILGPVVGWRAWLVVDTPAGARLHSTVRAQHWPTGTALRATCRPPHRLLARRRPPHAAPLEQCTCGLYAVSGPPAALAVLDPYARLGWHVRHRVVGQVNLWGRVVECTGGWRAEFGYPAGILVPRRQLHGAAVAHLDRIVDDLAAYGVPVDVLDAGSRSEIRTALTLASI